MLVTFQMAFTGDPTAGWPAFRSQPLPQQIAALLQAGKMRPATVVCSRHEVCCLFVKIVFVIFEVRFYMTRFREPVGRTFMINRSCFFLVFTKVPCLYSRVL